MNFIFYYFILLLFFFYVVKKKSIKINIITIIEIQQKRNYL